MDDFSKWAEAIPLKTHTARSVASAILQHWTARYGVPQELMSDQGPEFESAVFKHICNIMGITKLRSSPYHPMGNGAVERLNRTLKSLLLAHADRDREQWDQTLPYCMWAYRANVHHSTGFTPARLVFGRELRFPIDVVLESHEGVPTEAADYAEWVQESLKVTSREAWEHLIAAKARQKRYYDRRATPVPVYHVGDLVWMRNHRVEPGLNAKLSRPWIGPYLVSRVISEANVEVRDPSSARRIPPIHVNNLKPCHQDVRLDRTESNVAPVAPNRVDRVDFIPDVGNEVEIDAIHERPYVSLQMDLEPEDFAELGELPEDLLNLWRYQLGGGCGSTGPFQTVSCIARPLVA